MEQVRELERYFSYKRMSQFAGEQAHEIRLDILFREDGGTKLVLPETSIYASTDDTEHTAYRMGAITVPITAELPEIKEESS